MVLAKTDLALAKRYADLASDRDVAEPDFRTVEAEWKRTVRAQRDHGHTQRLADNATLARSIQHRFLISRR